MTRILIIDDDTLTLQLYDLLLEDIEGVQHTKAIDGTDGLEVLSKLEESEWPHYIFIDLHMPDMSGYEFVDQYLKSFDSNKSAACKLYFLTSSISQRDEEIAKKYPAVSGFLSKPLTEETLNRIIAQPHQSY